MVCEGRVLTLSEWMLRIETGRETQDVPSTADAFLVEDTAFVDAIRSAATRNRWDGWATLTRPVGCGTRGRDSI
jgi:hypothetical protein